MNRAAWLQECKHFHEELQARHGFELGYSWLKLRLHDAGLGASGQAARGPPAQAAAQALCGHDAASGRQPSRLTPGRERSRPDRDARRCDERDLLGLSRRRGGDRLELPPADGDLRGQGPALQPLHRPCQPLLPYAPGRRQGGQSPPHPGRPRARPARRRAYRRLFAPRRAAGRSECSPPCRIACPRS